jgi:CHAT domain-containing protein
MSALVLSSEPRTARDQDDGYLTAREIGELKLDADLVVLSACDTGLGRLVRGEGVVGLAHSFLSAGARGLVMSLWPVSDDATVKLMTMFYKELERAGSPAVALARVKRAFMRGDAGAAFKDPVFWAPFVYYGR